jgi:hypothetical protein
MPEKKDIKLNEGGYKPPPTNESKPEKPTPSPPPKKEKDS